MPYCGSAQLRIPMVPFLLLVVSSILGQVDSVFVSPPVDCIAGIVNKLGWQLLEIQFSKEDKDFCAACWWRALSEHSLLVHFSYLWWNTPSLPPFSNGGFAFNTHPQWPPHSAHHWIHVITDPAWRPSDGPAGWVSYLYHGDDGWQFDTLRWCPTRRFWVLAPLGKCRADGAGYEENERGITWHLITTGNLLVPGALHGAHIKFGFGAAPGKNSSIVHSAGYEDGIVIIDGEIMPGPQASIIETISSWLGFSYSIHPVYGTSNQSVWEVLVDEVQQNKVQIGLALLAPSPSRREKVDFLHAYYSITTYVTVRRPRLDTAAFNIGQPFSSEVWWALLAMLCLTLFSSYVVACAIRWISLLRQPRGGKSVAEIHITTSALHNTVRLGDPGGRVTKDGRPSAGALASSSDTDVTPQGVCHHLHQLSSHVLYVLGMVSRQGVEIPAECGYSTGMLFASLSLFSLFVYTYYTGVMLSFMAVVVPTPAFNSLSEAVDLGYRFRYRLGSQEGDMLRGSNTGIVRQMAAESEPIAYDGSESAFTDYAYSELGEKEVILATDAFLPADEHFADPEKCPLCYWPEPISTTAAGMVVTKGFGDAWMISRYIRVFQETGILNRWRRRLRRTTYTGSRLCSTEATTSQYRQLGLGSVATIYVTLAAGLLLSLLVLAAEIVVFSVSRRRKRQRPGR